MTAFDEGLLSPVTAGHDEAVSDAAVLEALVCAEQALVTAYREIGMLPESEHEVIVRVLRGDASATDAVDLPALVAASVDGGNPVIPLVAQLKDRVPEPLRPWVHRGATSQDIVDTAMMIIALAAVERVRESLTGVVDGLRGVAERHGRDVVAARTLTQHALPITLGARVATWARGVDRAITRLAALEFPAQLAGAAGTRASFVEITGSVDRAESLVEWFARHARLETPAESWQVTRWPITELGDALVQTIDALGKIASDVATLSRTEIGELSEGRGGGSSAMPQKQNPVASTLIRSAALRAPHLGATLHLVAALAVDERPDGAWHAEWPTLRELLRLALGASAHASSLARSLRVDPSAASRNLALTGALIVSERLAIVLVPLIGRARFDELIASAAEGADLGEFVRALPEAVDLDLDGLLDPASYTGADGSEDGR
ncbi:lyase family protein [Microbacterium sp. CFBP9023]|uniref:lyase family protein n=1 Tax=Microbacterium sp. CFBP9023 TaxID=3096535 RepID=UPI002A6B8395|nr:lyase family protein [Microbacterium sp. CFBP9023]MDY0985009.1 lyase family protein [Microbacterium sp. CFBP9023]